MIKGVIYALLGAGAVGTASICEPCGAAESSARPQAVEIAVIEPKTDTLHVEGMTCGGCVVGVRKVLTRLAGVTKAEVSYEHSRAVVTYDPQKVTVEQMIEAIKTLGYKASVVRS